MLIGIFGTGRNGSSLLGRLLDGLGATYVHPVEEKFLTAFEDLSRYGRVTRLVEQNCTLRPLSWLDQKLGMEYLASYFNFKLDEIHNHCLETAGDPRALKRLKLPDVVGSGSFNADHFIRAYLEGLGRILRPDVCFEHYLFKSIETPYLAEYEARFADMRFIHIMRHPVQVCSSQKRSLMENKALPASYLGYDWLSCMLDMRWLPHARFIKDRQGDPRHIVVRYEDLVKEPTNEIRRIAVDLGLTPPPRPETQTIFHDLNKSNWGFNPSKKGVEMPVKVVADLQRRNRYQEVLTSREIDVIAVKTRGLLEQFGYERPSDASRLKTMTEYLLLDKWELMHCRSLRLLLRGLFGILYRRVRLL